MDTAATELRDETDSSWIPTIASTAPSPRVRGGDLLLRLFRLTVLVAVGTAFLDFAEAVVLPVVLAGVFALALRPPVRWLVRARVPAPVAALVVMLMLLVPVAVGFSQFASPAVEWFEEAPKHIARLKVRLMGVLQPALKLSEAAASVGRIDSPGTRVPAPVEVKDLSLASTVFTWTGSALVGFAEMIALLFLLLASSESFLHKLVRLMPTWADKRRIVTVAREVQQGISTYLFSVGVINLGFGVVVTGALALAGMPQPVMWGLVAALLNFIPYFGPVLGVILIGVAGLLSFDSLGRGLVPMVLYLAIHLVEANLLTPFVVGRRVILNPVVVFVSLMFFGWLWGLPGAFVAVPLMVVARIVGEQVPAIRPYAAFMGR
ncbi:MAG: AI-2E family transporter [Verrucomicrobia bacterium]|nr:AI-2E family transporter [Verrucomicrobiota bacterium]